MIDAPVAVAHGPMRLRWRDERTSVLHPASQVLDGIIGWAHQPLPRRRSLSYILLGAEVKAEPGLYLVGAGCSLRLPGLVQPGHPMWAGYLLWVVRCWCELDLADSAEFVAGASLWEARVVRISEPDRS